MLLNAGFCLVVMLGVYFFSKELISLFTADATVINIGEEYLFIVIGFMFFSGSTNLLNGMLRGAGNTVFAMITSLLCLWIIRIPLAYFLSEHFGTHGLWWAISLSFCIGFVATLIYVIKKDWKKNVISTGPLSYQHK